MKMGSRDVLAAMFFALSLTACLSELTAQGAAVNVGKGEPGSVCKELGIVYGSGGGGSYTSSEDKVRSAQNELRNKAAELGGNYVEVDAATGDVRSTTLSGRVFRCIATAASDPEAVRAKTAPQPTEARTLEERLTKLRSLFDQGLITQDEYDKRRAEILQSL
jgi:hypothetical protein